MHVQREMPAGDETAHTSKDSSKRGLRHEWEQTHFQNSFDEIAMGHSINYLVVAALSAQVMIMIDIDFSDVPDEAARERNDPDEDARERTGGKCSSGDSEGYIQK